ncbi:hypothetical protein ACA910_004320 [Epithemia clementina (nom. ined.)]
MLLKCIIGANQEGHKKEDLGNGSGILPSDKNHHHVHGVLEQLRVPQLLPAFFMVTTLVGITKFLGTLLDLDLVFVCSHPLPVQKGGGGGGSGAPKVDCQQVAVAPSKRTRRAKSVFHHLAANNRTCSVDGRQSKEKPKDDNQ